MFKGILPGKRAPSAEFTMVTPLGDIGLNGKENQSRPTPVSTVQAKATTKSNKNSSSNTFKHHKVSASTVEPGAMNQAFDRLLDDLQIPSTLRPKLVGMEPSVKAAMLKSSQTLAIAVEDPASPEPTRRLRRVQSGSSISIESPRPQRSAVQLERYQTAGRPLGAPNFGADDSAIHYSPRPKSRAQGDGAYPEGGPGPKSAKDKGSMNRLSSTQFVSILTGRSSVELDVDIVKKLRIMLRNEPASWTQEFLKSGGYSALLTRLNELLEIEWREEQHDDQLLHELLRCLKALETSSIGCFALRSSCPTPFQQLVTLLFSDKKPGDVATRQLIVDLILILFELYPSSSSLPPSRDTWDPQAITANSPKAMVPLPHPHKHVYSLVRSLLLTPAPPGAEAPASPLTPHEFIDALHRPRIYKTYLQELSDVCRDYFWVFCHPNNTLWSLADTDEARVEKPRAPGGMTGGVEFEAMGYMTTHFKLVNSVAKAALELNYPKEHELSAHRLHTDLFLSGIERILVIARKASTTYYPTLHLELARYIALVGQARFELPWTVSRLIGPPPSAVCKRTARSATNSTRASPHSTPTKKSDVPVLPSPRRIEPIKFN
ncbi:hypothetical protein DENSPDRAFT_847772 [Dentipellis sp. KUC8613]|nr:hypothetical protein DENSPDRAFT_847772 [Dentipellis sp. KUC8613]